MRTIICLHCGRRVISNKKLKHLDQRYCGRKTCQRARKLHFERDKYKNDPLYRSRKLEKIRERKRIKVSQGHPQYYSQYQRAYRASHPEYVIKNRVKQRERYVRKQDKRTSETKIVNPDALMMERIDNLPYRNTKPLFVRLL